MYKSDSPYIEDWFIVSLRWLVLLGATVSLSIGGQLLSLSSMLLLLLICWNVVVAIFTGLNRRFAYHRQISLAIDIIITALFFYLQGGASGPAAWLILLTLVTGAVYFDLWGGLGAALGMALVEGVGIFLLGISMLDSIIAIVITLSLGLAFGFMSQKIIGQLRASRQKQVVAREKQNRVENDRLRAILDLTTALTATLSYKRVLDSALDLSVNALHVDDAEAENATPK